MPLKIYIQDEDVGDLLEFYTGKLKAIKDKKIAIDLEESAVRATILQLKGKNTHKCSSLGKEDGLETMTIKMKIEFDENHRLGTTELMPDGKKGATEWATKVKT